MYTWILITGGFFGWIITIFVVSISTSLFVSQGVYSPETNW